MTLSAGSHLGTYGILSPLGAGGMGEVWRARDSRLSRDVAIKVLPDELSSDPERLRRFEREARAASALSHPNIVTIYEVARLDSTSYIAMELVEGKTLREIAAGAPLPFRKILSIAPQIAEGLARAHTAGIVHRDLKPENVMVTADGIVKILDFGLAKLTHPLEDAGHSMDGKTVSAPTRPGIAMGTVSYMSPEQASGYPVDFRSDQFSLGSMLYELASGKPAFKRPTTAQTLAAIIEDEPEPIARVAPKTPAPVRWVIERCLSKEPKGRYASTEDLARELADLRDHISDLSTGSGVAIEPPHPPPRWRAAILPAVILAAIAGAYVLGQRIQLARTSAPRFRQLTFRGAGIGTARFAPDGQTIVFSSQTEGRPPELLSMRLDSPETRSLGLPPAQILSISPAGQMAILLAPPFSLGPRMGHMAFEQVVVRDPFLISGTLAEAALAGGAPRELLEDVLFADWDPNAKDLAATRRFGNRTRLEYPVGTVLYDGEQNLLNCPRASFRGPLVFKDWDSLFLKPRGEPVRALSGPVAAAEIAWNDASGEVWYTIGPGTEFRRETHLRAMDPSGRDRLVSRLPGDFVLYDVTRDGRVLLGRLEETSEILGNFPVQPRERNLSHFDSSEVQTLSANGDVLLFTDVVRLPGFAYLASTDGGQPKHVSDEWDILTMSPDGKSLLCRTDTGFALAPTGAGAVRRTDVPGIGIEFVDSNRAGFLPDGKRIFFPASDGSRHRGVWVANLDDGTARPITPDDVRLPIIVGDGHSLCARAPDRNWYLYPVDEKAEPRKVVGIQSGEEPIQSTPEGLLYVRGADELRPGESLMTTRVFRVDPLTGRRELWKEMSPKDPRIGGGISKVVFSADGKTCVWTHIRYSTELVLAEGLK
jgi:hypothetical protein